MAKGFNSRGMGGFGGGMNMNMMKQVQKMQQDMMKMQQELETKTYTAAAGGGVVSATVTGKRELKEETGAVPDTFLPMGVTLPSPGCLSERLYLFLAKGLHMESQQLDEDEFLNVERIPFNEMVHRVMDGEIEDSKTIAAVLKAKVLLNL